MAAAKPAERRRRPRDLTGEELAAARRPLSSPAPPPSARPFAAIFGFIAIVLALARGVAPFASRLAARRGGLRGVAGAFTLDWVACRRVASPRHAHAGACGSDPRDALRAQGRRAPSRAQRPHPSGVSTARVLPVAGFGRPPRAPPNPPPRPPPGRGGGPSPPPPTPSRRPAPHRAGTSLSRRPRSWCLSPPRDLTSTRVAARAVPFEVARRRAVPVARLSLLGLPAVACWVLWRTAVLGPVVRETAKGDLDGVHHPDRVAASEPRGDLLRGANTISSSSSGASTRNGRCSCSSWRSSSCSASCWIFWRSSTSSCRSSAPVIYGGTLDPSWVTIMIAVNLQTSFLTPPFGFALFLSARRGAAECHDGAYLPGHPALRAHPGPGAGPLVALPRRGDATSRSDRELAAAS